MTIYKDRLAARHETAARDRQYERDRDAARNAFQRESILALQAAVSDLLKAAYEELDRAIAESRRSGSWPARQWETPTAIGWSESLLRLEALRARVFDDELRRLAGEIRETAGDAVWARDLDAAKESSRRLEPLQSRFNEAVTEIIPSLY
ncbi:hypothetical protein [Actinoallomurus rhizosphaericola]|uniref:hypothetical protein n=1 Tax=Actinoallomurus rhizosphaericola TaxID=2952536 RepID=UPI002093EA86|nr:hypothetical protein [Actinoallomurus rhizosphaericola]MCO5999674.1 hypothetical protein [Actinoallomurus rhizosphaericola]